MSEVEQKKVDIVLLSPVVKRLLKERFNELGLKVSQVVLDANEKGMSTITKEKLSRYLNKEVPVKGFPTQRDILWLCTRYAIRVRLRAVKEPWDEHTEAIAIELANQVKNG